MTLTALLLVLLAALAHATWNLLAKGAAGGGAFVWLASLVAGAALAPVALVIAVVSEPEVGWDGVAFMAGSGALHTAYFVCVQRGYATGDLSLVYPLARGSGPLLATVIAVLALGERPGPLVVAGGLLIAGAVISLAARTPRPQERAAVGYALLTGLLIGIYTVWDKHAVDGLGQSPVIYLLGNYAVMLILLAPLAARRRDLVRTAWADHRRAVLGVGLLGPAAYVLVLVALTTTDVAYVAPAREVSIVFATLLGAQVLGEGSRVRRMIAAVVIVAGVALLALG